jgi:hypothetical protein
MPKLKPSALPQEDIEKYLQENEDFAFEMSCVANLVNLGLEVEHGGTYSDPVTNLKRQFDIRAYYEYADRAQIAFAIECKNLKANFPLVVSRVPRTRDEAFHEIFCPAESRGVISAGHGPLGRAKRIDSTGSFYVINQPVGKSTIQIGRLENDQFYANDSEVYEKWAQAVASACGLLKWSAELLAGAVSDGVAVVPILVVPNGTLWVADYTAEGISAGKPQIADECEFYLGYEVLDESNHNKFTFSHLHFVTVSGLEKLIKNLTENRHAYFRIFSVHRRW